VRWLAQTENRRMVGRGIALLFAGLLVAGSMIGRETADRKRGEKLTREQYDANFESYRRDLIESADAPLLDIIMGVTFAAIAFATLEGAGIVIGVSGGAADEAMERRRARRRSSVIDDTDD
jgi:hypothetical protein